jgi:hypothetical protein
VYSFPLCNKRRFLILEGQAADIWLWIITHMRIELSQLSKLLASAFIFLGGWIIGLFNLLLIVKILLFSFSSNLLSLRYYLPLLINCLLQFPAFNVSLFSASRRIGLSLLHSRSQLFDSCVQFKLPGINHFFLFYLLLIFCLLLVTESDSGNLQFPVGLRKQSPA